MNALNNCFQLSDDMMVTEDILNWGNKVQEDRLILQDEKIFSNCNNLKNEYKNLHDKRGNWSTESAVFVLRNNFIPKVQYRNVIKLLPDSYQNGDIFDYVIKNKNIGINKYLIELLIVHGNGSILTLKDMGNCQKTLQY